MQHCRAREAVGTLCGLLAVLLFLPSPLTPAQESAVTSAPSARVWLDPEGKPLPFARDEELLEFLRSANVVRMEEISEGITKPRKVLLEKDGLQMHAVFRWMDHDGTGRVTLLADGRRVIGFRDSYVFEPAAYQLGRLLGLDNIPPAVLRKIEGKKGSLQVWIENATPDRVRLEKRINPPNPQRWSRQVYRMWVFDELVFNTDRNVGNILSDPNWKLWMIDHTRAFRATDELMSVDRIHWCERNLWERLQALQAEAVEARLKELLRGREIDALLKRRDKLVAYIRSLIQEHGEEQVLYALP